MIELLISQQLAFTDCFAIAALTIATGMTVVVLEDFSLHIFQEYNGCFLLLNHNRSCAYCSSSHGH